MNDITIEKVQELLVKDLLPKADYSSLDSFLKTISPEDLGEMINLSESRDEDMLEFLSYVIALVFMYEYDQEVCREVDLANLFTQFQRQCIAEACARVGVWDTSKEDRRLVPAIEPLELTA